MICKGGRKRKSEVEEGELVKQQDEEQRKRSNEIRRMSGRERLDERTMK
jgi:hypothetical protein